MNISQPIQESDSVPRAYSSDGGFTIAGLMMTFFLGAFVALAVGLLAGVIGQYFYMVLLFPIGIGAAVGGAQVAVIGRTKIRSPIVCGFAGLVAGVIAVTAMHYVDYVVFRQGMADAEREYNASVASLEEIEEVETREAFAAALAEYQSGSELRDAKRIDSFLAYVDWAARQGVEISSSTSTRSSNNLGYVGTYGYWAIEALVIAGICVVMTRSRAAQPFCVECDEWMPETELVTLNCDAKSAAKAIGSGTLSRLPSLFDANKETSLSVYSCGRCPKSDVIVQPNAVTYNNGNRCTKGAGRFVFASSTLQQLEQLFFDVEQGDEEATKRLESEIATLDNLTDAANQNAGNAQPKSDRLSARP